MEEKSAFRSVGIFLVFEIISILEDSLNSLSYDPQSGIVVVRIGEGFRVLDQSVSETFIAMVDMELIISLATVNKNGAFGLV